MTTPRRHRYRKLRVDEISFVDRGASPGARIEVFKRREPVSKDGKQPPTLQEVLAAIPEEQRKVVEAALAEGARAVQAQAQHESGEHMPAQEPQQNQSPEAPKPPAPPPPQQQAKEPNPMADKTPEQIKQEEEALKKSLTEQIKKQLEDESKAERETLAKKLAEAEAESKKQAEAIAKMQDESLERECVAKAAEFPRGAVGLAKAEVVSILKSLRQKKPLADEAATKLVGHFAAVEELLAKSALFKELGSSIEGDDASPQRKLESIAKSLKEKNPDLSEALAYEQAAKNNPQLYAQVRAQERR